MSRFEHGHILVHRSMTSGESDIGTNGHRLAILVTLISWANWKDGERTVQCNGKPRKLQRGQVLIGVRELADHLGFSKDTVFRQLKYLCERDTIRKEAATEGTLVTILNYDQYQSLTKILRQDCDTDATGAGHDPGRPPNASRTPIEEDNEDRHKEDVAQSLVNLWNENSGTLPKVKDLTQKRRVAIRERLRAEPNLNVWLEGIKKIAASDWCNARAEKNKSWEASFDFLLKPDSLTKVLEGQYDNRGAGEQRRPSKYAPDTISKEFEAQDELRRQMGVR